MDYSRICFPMALLILFILTTKCFGAPPVDSMDLVKQESETPGKTEQLPTSLLTEEAPAAAASTTAEGDLIITAPSESTGDQILSSEDSPAATSNSSPGDQTAEKTSIATSHSSTLSESTLSENPDASSVAGTETKHTDEAAVTTEASAKPPITTDSGKEEPQGSSSHHTHNGAPTILPLNTLAVFLIGFVSRAFLLKI